MPARKSTRSPRKSARKTRTPRKGKGTKGWKAVSPHIPSARKRMSERCKSKGIKDCFLIPSERKFPIRNPSTLKMDCRGLRAAKVRAAQLPKYHHLVPRINKLKAKNGC